MLGRILFNAIFFGNLLTWYPAGVAAANIFKRVFLLEKTPKIQWGGWLSFAAVLILLGTVVPLYLVVDFVIGNLGRLLFGGIPGVAEHYKNHVKLDQNESEKKLERMQTTEAKQAVEKAFDANPEELGKAAVEAAKKKGEE